MVEAYWEIGGNIVEKQGGNATAEYGTKLIEELSKQMTADFGKGFTTLTNVPKQIGVRVNDLEQALIDHLLLSAY